MVMWVWVVVAVAAVIGEVLTTDLFLACVAVAALLTVLTVGFLPVGLQIVVFSGLSLLGIGVVRPAIKRGMGIDSLVPMSGPERHTHLIGKRGTVTRAVDGAGGQIEIGQGEYWTARSFNAEDEIPVGSQVVIEVVDGVVALVSPLAKPEVPTGSDLTLQKG